MQFYSLFISFRGRITRTTFLACTIIIWSVFFGSFILWDSIFGTQSTLLLYPLTFWMMFSVAAKRCHDFGSSAKRLAWLMVPVVGPLYVGAELLFRSGNKSKNRHGIPLEEENLDYLSNGGYERTSDDKYVVNDVTQLNPVKVDSIFEPATQDELAAFISTADRLSIGGGRFSMGGQTASPDSIHIDTRKLNRVISFSPQEKYMRVETGIRWCDIQRFLDPHNLSVKIMQTYANFTVGGSISVNCHGRYVGLGPVSLSVRSIKLLLANGDIKECNEQANRDLFYAALGCYGAIGIILEAEIDVADNLAIERTSKKMAVGAYRDFFFDKIKSDKTALFHNGDIYPPHYSTVNAVTWKLTKEVVNLKSRLPLIQRKYPIHRFFFWIFSESHFGTWYREHIIDPIIFCFSNVRWRNREASYDVNELEPVSRNQTTYVLQEYFVPVSHFDDFVKDMAEIFQRHNVNCINVSIRHAMPDNRPLLSWARAEVFAFVVYYKQEVTPAACLSVGIWTRELIDAVLKIGGTYYLPYQPHASQEQFHQAFPHAQELFAIKREKDPSFKFHNCLWDKYYQHWLDHNPLQAKGKQS